MLEAEGMVAQTIQLALAPVFVLVAIGNIMNILSTRLGRVVDRSRVLQDMHAATSGADHDRVVREISSVNKITDTEALKLIEQSLAKSPRRIKGAEADEEVQDEAA